MTVPGENEGRRPTLTPAMFALLLALHAGDRHGYALMDDVAGLTDGTITLGPGTLYRSLQRLRIDGLVEELDAGGTHPPPADRRAERRRTYRITRAGRTTCAGEARRLALLVTEADRLGLLAEPRNSED